MISYRISFVYRLDNSILYSLLEYRLKVISVHLRKNKGKTDKNTLFGWAQTTNFLVKHATVTLFTELHVLHNKS